jgi:predicted nucleic acid-binding protein
VKAELDLLTHVAGKSRVATALAEGWLSVEPVALSPAPMLPFVLDVGETEAILLARQTHADVLLMGERRGRAAARALGLSVGGVLGELLHAKQTGWIPELKAELTRLRTEAGFYLDSEIERFILSQANE